MKFKSILAALLLTGGVLTAQAQYKDTKVDNWFLQLQAGASYTSGDNNFGGLISPAGQISVGKYFNETVGARLAFSGWRGRGGYGNDLPGFGFFYGAATVDGLFNLSSLFAGKNPERFFNASLIAGLGFNQTFGDSEKGHFMGRVGLQGKFRLNEAFDFNIEALANGVGDKWNGLEDHGMDTYFNVLLGVTYKFGTGFNLTCPDCEPVYYENDCYDEEYVQSLNNQVNKLRKQIAEHKCPEPEPRPEVKIKTHGIRSHVVFDLGKVSVRHDQEMNVMSIATYLKGHPEAKASITGYADKETGTAEINSRLAKQRADAVAAILVEMGIDANRLVVDSKGSEEQPFDTNHWNRVVLMVAE